MRRSVRAADAALLAVLVLVLVFVGVTLQRFTSGSSGALVPAAGPVGTPGFLQAVQGPPRLLVIGDDFAAGEGASTPANGFARVLADELDAPYTIDALPDSGFVARGPEAGVDGSFPARVQRLVERDGPEPDLVVVEGGHEDYAASPRELRAAVELTAERLTEAYPDAQVLIMGTTRAFPENQVLEPLHRALRAGAEAAGVPFIDPVAEQWVRADNTAAVISPDLFHPNDAGHALWASRLLAAVRALPAA